jgi:hypothetical protein
LRCRRIGLGLPRRTLLLLGQDVRRRDANRKRNGNSVHVQAAATGHA